VAVRCGGMPLGNHMNTRPRTRSEAHMGVYVNESGTLGDIAEWNIYGISGVGYWY
jgi:hypothetical protein